MEEFLTKNEEICKYIENGKKYKLVEDSILPPDLKLMDCLSEKEVLKLWFKKSLKNQRKRD